MSIRKLFTGLILCFSGLLLNAQDLHFTNFRLAPLTVNPALAGAFEGSIRVGGVYRGQWLDVNGYKTPAFYADAPIIRGLRKNDWVGVGVSFYSDKAGAGRLSDSGGGINVAYHLGLDKKNIRNNIAFGVSWGTIKRTISNQEEDFTFKSELLQNPTSPTLNLVDEMDGIRYSDWSAGLTLHYDLTKRNRLITGIAAGHITTPVNSVIRGERNSEEGFKITGFAQLDMQLTSKFSFEPALLFQFESPGKELALQGLAGYMINPKKQLELTGGLGYRVGDAVQLLLGANYGDLMLGASFDANASSFQGATGFQNGFEIGAAYIFKIYKKPNVKPVIICPRF